MLFKFKSKLCSFLLLTLLFQLPCIASENALSLSSLTTEEQLENANGLTIKANKAYESLVFYPGGSYANKTLEEVIEHLDINRDPVAWQNLLNTAIKDGHLPAHIHKRSQNWVKAYNSFMIKIINLLQPVVDECSEMCIKKYGKEEKCRQVNLYDHWQSLKSYE